MFTIADLCVGNADTEMAAGQKAGVLQPDGSIKAEATFDVKHVADAIVHIAGLPLDVTVLNFNIMSVILYANSCAFANLFEQGFAHAVDWQRLISVHRSRRFQQKSLVYLYTIKKICVRKPVECVYAILLQPTSRLLLASNRCNASRRESVGTNDSRKRQHSCRRLCIRPPPPSPVHLSRQDTSALLCDEPHSSSFIPLDTV